MPSMPIPADLPAAPAPNGRYAEEAGIYPNACQRPAFRLGGGRVPARCVVGAYVVSASVAAKGGPGRRQTVRLAALPVSPLADAQQIEAARGVAAGLDLRTREAKAMGAVGGSTRGSKSVTDDDARQALGLGESFALFT